MKCPFCGSIDSKVVDSRAMEDGKAIRRRRQCESCGERFTTYERIDIIPVAVIKRNGERESFDRSKLLNGIIKSCNKRPISMEEMEKIADYVEGSVLNSLNKEIESNKIGEMVMDKLKEVDEVAYVRFASVYKKFKDIDTFMEELSKLLREKNN
ncbi:transcriptional regulator NrdR [Anaeropeptidivorans aminofermentans]|jgi:transcriptional repressor NrdR|uniref:transcriptional regulator NrdR n=1 Tax=Anaeropeptidivorans aminofermentans TaxID=2934315 RepID=UPI002024977D|nr:transcriptional regulator NrdR [Anaeropeptidivorans aminofermentans]